MFVAIKPIVTDELIAILRRLSRAMHQQSQPVNKWMLDTVRWHVTEPSGLCVALTRSELNLLSAFVNKSGITINRNEIVSALGYNPDHYDMRRLEVLVRRLRNKFEKIGLTDFPLSTVYGVGYVFNSPISLL